MIKIADTVDELLFADNNLVEIEVAGKRVCIAKYNEVLFACAAKCPHAGGNMAAGYIDALGKIVCPLHRYKFDLNNGRNTTGEGYYLKTYEVIIKEDGVFLSIEKKKGFFDIFS